MLRTAAGAVRRGKVVKIVNLVRHPPDDLAPAARFRIDFSIAVIRIAG
jgi:hypothetical protein